MVDIEGNYEIGAPCALVWELVQDPDVLSRIMPGCEKLELTGENEYQGKMRIQVGPVDGLFQGTLLLSDVRPLEGFHLLINGHGPSGVIRGEGDLQLQPTDSGTKLTYDGSGQVSGRMASVGQRLMSSSAKAVTKQCLQNLERQVQARQQPVVEKTAATAAEQAAELPDFEAPPAPSQMEFMVGVGEEFINDLFPDPQQRRLALGAVLAILVFLFLNWYANLVARKVARQLRDES